MRPGTSRRILPQFGARRADILAEQEGFQPEWGIVAIADHLFACPREIPDRFIVHFRDIHRRAIPGAGQLRGVIEVVAVPVPADPAVLREFKDAGADGAVVFVMPAAEEAMLGELEQIAQQILT